MEFVLNESLDGEPLGSRYKIRPHLPIVPRLRVLNLKICQQLLPHRLQLPLPILILHIRDITKRIKHAHNHMIIRMNLRLPVGTELHNHLGILKRDIPIVEDQV